MSDDQDSIAEKKDRVDTLYYIRDWWDFQHYKNGSRNPPWIKLHYALLSSQAWVMLDDASKLLAIATMLVASRHNGFVPNNPNYLKRVAHLKKTPNFKPLLDCGFLITEEEAKILLANASDSVSISDSVSESRKGGMGEKQSPSLDELSLDHISEWLAKQRAAGKYLQHDEAAILDHFKDYCLSKGKTYKNYPAALRNAFKWEIFQPKGNNHGIYQHSNRSGRRTNAHQPSADATELRRQGITDAIASIEAGS